VDYQAAVQAGTALTGAAMNAKMVIAGPMPRRELEDIRRHIRDRERVLVGRARLRSAALREQVEEQLAAIYSWDDHPTWAKIANTANKLVAEAQVDFDKACEELRIPKNFRPSMGFMWGGRGENAVASRRTELRRVAQARIETLERKALTQIQQMSLEALVVLTENGLESAAAKKFFADLPDLEKLMPSLNVAEVVRLLLDKRRELPSHRRYGQPDIGADGEDDEGAEP
jgi:hypothetical protein